MRVHLPLTIALALASLVTSSIASADETNETPPATTPATTEAPPAAVETPPAAETKTPVKAQGDLDHRYEGGLRVGVMVGGTISPVNWFRSNANPSPSFAYDGGFLVNRHFIFGAYAQLTPYSFDRVSGEKTIGDGSGLFASSGFSIKGRLPISDTFSARAGATIGFNLVTQAGKMKDGKGEFEFFGRGLNVGLNADAVWRASPKVGAVAQLAFLTQPLGEADVVGWPSAATAEGATRDFRFSPKIFLMLGPELFMW
jgi:hypothetical protein